METIIDQLFWLWVPLSFLPIWLRMAIVIYLIVILARPIICWVIPKLLYSINCFLKKGIELISYPIMVWFNVILVKRRREDIHDIPAWIEFIEDSFSLSIKCLDFLAKPTQKRRNFPKRMKKVFRVAGITLALLLPTAVINNPSEPYAKAWQNFETWVAEEKLEKALGYIPDQFHANSEDKMAEFTQTKLSLTERFKHEGANIRETPSLQGKIIESIAADETAIYLEEAKTDNSGIRWLKVETNTGTVGWVSSRIVEQE